MDNKLRETTNSCVEIWWIVGDKQRENLVMWYKSRLPFDLNVMLNLPSIKPQVIVVQATILVTNRWNRHRFSRIFWKNHEISTSHCFPPWNVPSPSPMLSHAYFEALRPLWYPNQHWGRGNRHKCFKIFDEYCSCHLPTCILMSALIAVWRSVPRTVRQFSERDCCGSRNVPIP